MSKKSVYRVVCWKTCFWKNTLWQPGEIYEGEDPPGKYFMGEDEEVPEEEVVEAGSDPRPNVEIKRLLKENYDFKVPSSWKRKQMWSKLREFEIAESKDASPNPFTETFRAACGFEAKSNAGRIAHQSKCEKCKELIE